MNGISPKDRVTVASEKADFMADRIAAGIPAPEEEVRRLAQYLRELATSMAAAPSRSHRRASHRVSAA